MIDAELPTDSGRRLAVGAFVLADPFDTILRELSSAYLTSAWRRLQGVLTAHKVRPTDLSWGWLYPTETYAPDLFADPCSFTGWSSRDLAGFNSDPRWAPIDRELRSGRPALACAVTWRSRKWAISPADVERALQLIEDLWTGEPTDWAPERIVEEHARDHGAWIAVARAAVSEDQQAFDRAFSEAARDYTPAGYRVMLRGYATAIMDRCDLTFPGHPSAPSQSRR